MDFFNKIPVMDRTALRELKKGIDLSFKDFSRATGGEYGFRLDKSIALAMVKPDLANVGEKLKVDILGKMYEATILDESPYDAENKLLRA